MYKEDLVLNNEKWLICQKTQPNPTKYDRRLLCVSTPAIIPRINV